MDIDLCGDGMQPIASLIAESKDRATMTCTSKGELTASGRHYFFWPFAWPITPDLDVLPGLCFQDHGRHPSGLLQISNLSEEDLCSHLVRNL